MRLALHKQLILPDSAIVNRTICCSSLFFMGAAYQELFTVPFSTFPPTMAHARHQAPTSDTRSANIAASPGNAVFHPLPGSFMGSG